jgi:hypothetical protein
MRLAESTGVSLESPYCATCSQHQTASSTRSSNLWLAVVWNGTFGEMQRLLGWTPRFPVYLARPRGFFSDDARGREPAVPARPTDHVQTMNICRRSPWPPDWGTCAVGAGRADIAVTSAVLAMSTPDFRFSQRIWWAVLELPGGKTTVAPGSMTYLAT